MLISINFRFPSHLLFNQFSMRILQPMCSAFRGLRWQFLGRQCFLPSTLTMTEDFSNGLSPLWHQPAERFLMPSSHPTVLTKYILTKDQKGERPAHPHGCCGLLLLLLKRTNTNHDVRAKAKNNSQAALLVPLESFSHDSRNPRQRKRTTNQLYISVASHSDHYSSLHYHSPGSLNLKKEKEITEERAGKGSRVIKLIPYPKAAATTGFTLLRSVCLTRSVTLHPSLCRGIKKKPLHHNSL